MNIGIAIFAYWRFEHLEQVLKALKESRPERPKKLYIFQDGLKGKEHQEEWLQTTKLIESIDWCSVEFVKASVNQGLANSIVKGVTYVLDQNDGVIILEDDCVPMPGFLDYMRRGLEKYRTCEKIFHIGGYGNPAFMKLIHKDIYFRRGVDSWGWGTWKDRWNTFDYKKDYFTLLQTDRQLALEAALWSGLDIQNWITGHVNGKTDTWATQWALNIMEHNGMCMLPRQSLVKNVGFDGTGTNCVVTSEYETEYYKGEVVSWEFPEEIEITDEVICAYVQSGRGSDTALKELFHKGLFTEDSLIDDTWKREQKKALVYGVGEGFTKREKVINTRYQIEAFIDKSRVGTYAGIEIIKPSELSKYIDKESNIIITLKDQKECKKIADNLVELYGFDRERIIFSYEEYKNICVLS